MTSFKSLLEKLAEMLRTDRASTPIVSKSNGKKLAKPEARQSKKSTGPPEDSIKSLRAVVPPTAEDSRKQPEREPYFIQVGLDFGTSYCKCVCRDILVDKAWVHLPSSPADAENPFLMPSALQVVEGSLCVGSSSAHYHERGLPHVKIALVKVALQEWDDPVLMPFHAILGRGLSDRITSFVAACAVYLLAGILGDIRNSVRRRFPDFGEHTEDRFGVNLAIPVADAERPQINNLFQVVLETALKHADALAAHPPLPLRTLSRLVPRMKAQAKSQADGDDYTCFIYPEVSAGVQGFVRSRVSAGGIYLFSETGAATVDQSVFILRRSVEEGDLLTYLHASVLSLGSSHIEREAAEVGGNAKPSELERWRKLKEIGEKANELRIARLKIGDKLARESYNTLGVARRKLDYKPQFEDIRVLFGGGGHVKNPYEDYVLKVFHEIQLHGKPFEPDVVGMPYPRDLEPAESISRWMNRLWIAYGLSFWPGDFPLHTYPKDVPAAQPLKSRAIPSAVSKDEC